MTSSFVSLRLADDTGASNSDLITSDSALAGTAAPRASITFDSNSVRLGTTIADAAGSWQFTPGGLPDGATLITASATDGSSAQFAFTLDTAPPVLRPAVTLSSFGQTILSGGGAAKAIVTVSNDGAVLGHVTAGSDGTWTIGLDGQNAGLTGLHHLGVSETDIAGNIGQSDLLFLQPPAPFNGVATIDASSADIDALRAQGSPIPFMIGTEAVQLVDGVLNIGPDTAQAYVQRLYEGLLGRAGDAGGLGGFSAAIASGTSRAAVAQAFLGSDEYRAVVGQPSDVQFVQDIYHALLGRGPDADGLAYFTKAIAGDASGASRAALVAGIADSDEAKAYRAADTSDVWARSAAGSMVNAVFETAFGREVDVGSAQYWGNALQTGLSASVFIATIASTAEFSALHGGQSNSDYVGDLYQAGLGRAPDAAGLAANTAVLASGALSRTDILSNIALSSEAAGHLGRAI